MQSAMAGAGELGRVMSGLPALASRTVALIEQLETMAREGLTLGPDTIAEIKRAEARSHRWSIMALWVIAAALVGLLWTIR
jgi:ubiquinone biosynthesis protein